MALDVAKVKAIIFDIDGTLSDSDNQMAARLEKLFKPLSYLNASTPRIFSRWLIMALESPANFIYKLADQIGIDNWFSRALGTANRKKKPKLYSIVSGVPEMLATLSDHFPLAVVSARDEKTSFAFLNQFNLVKYFQAVITSQTTLRTKPSPEPLIYAAEKIGIQKEYCLMVGDTTVDMRAAKSAGMQAVGVLCGFGREKELKRSGADVILPSTADLTDLLRISFQ